MHHRSGFTLLELMIVIVIFGVLVGGTLAGAQLMRNASLRTVMAELVKYEASVVTFRDQYSAYPGDMRNATNSWGSAGGDGSNSICQNTASSTEATCNGNGDGKILTSAVDLDETARAWQHLKNAELVTGNFVGTVHGLTQADLLTKVFQPSKRAGIGYQFYTASKPSMGWTNAPETLDILSIRAAGTTAASAPLPIRLGANSIASLDLYKIETKLDDGKPGLGRIFANYNSSCITGGTDATTANYRTNTESDERNCFFHFNLTN